MSHDVLWRSTKPGTTLAEFVDGVEQLDPQALVADGVNAGALHLADRLGDGVGVAGVGGVAGQVDHQ